MVNPALLRELFVPSGNLFVILAGAAIPGLLDKLHQETLESVCLYRGELPPDQVETAPYLVRLERDSRFTQWLLDQGWGKQWGIFARVGDQFDLKQVRHHFRGFLMVEFPDGKSRHLRYYDPRVLRAYLPTCNVAETQTVFGPVMAYIVEDQVDNRAIRFTVNKGLPYGETIRLD